MLLATDYDTYRIGRAAFSAIVEARWRHLCRTCASIRQIAFLPARSMRVNLSLEGAVTFLLK